MFAAVFRSLLPAAESLALSTAEDAARCHAVLWPLLIGTWKRKAG